VGGRPPPGPACGQSGGRHCTAGQYGYVPLKRHFVNRIGDNYGHKANDASPHVSASLPHHLGSDRGAQRYPGCITTAQCFHKFSPDTSYCSFLCGDVQNVPDAWKMFPDNSYRLIVVKCGPWRPLVYRSKDSVERTTLPWPVLSIRLAVLTVSPNRQYRGIFSPTTPATTAPTHTTYILATK